MSFCSEKLSYWVIKSISLPISHLSVLLPFLLLKWLTRLLLKKIIILKFLIVIFWTSVWSTREVIYMKIDVAKFSDGPKYTVNCYPCKFTNPYSELMNYFHNRAKWLLEAKNNIKAHLIVFLWDCKAKYSEVSYFL